MNHRTDVCVIGAGTAGAMLGAALAERGVNVLVLEAGPDFDRDRTERMERHLRPSYPSSSVWDMGGQRDAYTTSGEIDYPLNAHRVKGIGGSSLARRGMAPRLHPEDFAMRNRHDVAENWPISYGHLAPYYQIAEREIGVAGADHEFAPPRQETYPLPAHALSRMDQYLDPAFEAVEAPLHPCPQAINPEPYDGRGECVGYGTCEPVCPSGAKYSADVHVEKARKSGAAVIDSAPVRRLRMSDDGERIAQAIVVGEEEPIAVEADHFVIAAGGVEAARLLLLSVSEHFPDGIGNDDDQVGRYFTDHPAVSLRGRLNVPTGSDQIGFATRISEAFYPHHRGPEGSILLVVENATGQAPATQALQRRAHTGHLAEGDPIAPFRGAPLRGDLLDQVRDEYEGRIQITAIVEQRPSRENRVTLDHSRADDRGHPVPDIEYGLDTETRETLHAARDLLFTIFEEVGASGIETIGSPMSPILAGDRMGTTRMGRSPQTSVVDPDLKVHGLDNLYVCSTGAFVTFGAVSPTLTTAALGLRLADHLAERLG